MGGKGRSKYFYVAGGFVVLLLLLVVAFAIALPSLLHLSSVRERIIAQASREVNGEVSFSTLDLSLFPYPKVVIQRVSVRLPGKGDVYMDSLDLIPRILPLFKGQVVVRHVKMLGLKAHIYLPSGGGPPGHLGDKVKDFIVLLGNRVPGLVVDLQGGEVYIHKGGKKASLWVRGLKAHVVFPPQRLRLAMSFNSNVGKVFIIKGWLEPRGMTGKLRMSLKQFQPHRLACCLFHITPLGPVNSLMDLELTLSLNGLRDVAGVFKGAVPCLALRSGGHALVMECGNLEGSFHLLGPKIEVSLAHVDLKYPRLHLSGTFLWDPKIPVARLVVQGRDVDVPSVREMALSLLGANHTVKKIFGIVRGGELSLISFRDTAPAFSKLGSLDRMEIEGKVRRGTILIPKVGFKIENAAGEVVISKGVLKGKSLSGRLGNSYASNGTLILGLRGKELPFHLDTSVNADLSQLPSILERVLHKGLLLKEVRQVDEVKGRAIGRLVLGEDTRVERVEVKVHHVSFSCLYKRIPYAVKITGGTFYYRDAQVAVANLDGRIGKSTFSGLTARLNWRKAPWLQVSSMKAELSLDQLYPWIFSYAFVRRSLPDFKSMRGLLYVDALTLKGPLLLPGEWRFGLKGRVERFLFGFSIFPSTLKIEKGKVAITQDRISFQRCATLLEDAAFSASGSIEDYKDGVNRLALSLTGRAGGRSLRWLYGFVGLPQVYRLRPPVEARGVHVVWNRGGEIHLDGLLRRKGVEASMDLEVLPKRLSVKKLDLTGKGASCHLALFLKGQALDLAFNGVVNREVLDALLEKNTILKGWGKGDFEAHLLLNGKANFRGKGKVEIRGLTYLWGIKMPLNIDAASIEANDRVLIVRSARLGLGRSTLSLEGEATSSGSTIHLSLNVEAPSLDMRDIEELVGTGSGGGGWVLPVEGNIRVRANSFFYEGFTWSSVEGTVHLYPRMVRVEVVAAHLCGVSTPGVVTITPGNTSLRFSLWAKGASWDPALTCLFGRKGVAKGKFDLKGWLKAEGKEDPLAEGSVGEASLVSKKGRIYRLTILSKILSALNVMEMFKGNFPDFTKEGFAYNSIKGKGRLRDGIIYVEELVVDGQPMRIFGTGTVDLVKERLDLTVLVAPLKTLDTILSKVPVVGWILTGKSKTFISVPLKVKGPLNDPRVIPLSPSAVGSGLLGIMERTIKAPIHMIKPVIPQKEPTR